MIEVTPIPAFNDNYIWMIVHPERKVAAIVDPGDAEPVLEALSARSLTLRAILITHHHWDHTGGIEGILKHWDVPVYGPAHDAISAVDQPLSDQDHLHLPKLKLTLNVLDIPGHTHGHIAYYGNQRLFCGDTLFGGGCGRLFEGTASQMFQSLQRLAALPPETLVYSAHEYTALNLRFAKAVEPNNSELAVRIRETDELRAQDIPTLPSLLEEELATNPFLRCDTPDVKAAAEQLCGHALESPEAVFAVLRAWKDDF